MPAYCAKMTSKAKINDSKKTIKDGGESRILSPHGSVNWYLSSFLRSFEAVTPLTY